jgi:hypothetical protein
MTPRVLGQFEFPQSLIAQISRVAGPLAVRSASKLAGYTEMLKRTHRHGALNRLSFFVDDERGRCAMPADLTARNMFYRCWIVACAVFLFTVPALGRAWTLDNSELGISMTIPDGFASDPQLASRKPSIVYVYRKPCGREAISDVTIIIEKLNGTIGQARLTPQDLPKNFNGTLTTAHWNGREIDVVRIVEQVAGLQIVTYKAQVPLQPRAIQIWAAGNIDMEAEIRRLLDDSLASLKGQADNSVLPVALGARGSAAPGRAWGGASAGASTALALVIGAVIGLVVAISRLARGGV